MQSQFTDQRMANQCPICFAVLGSRKSFKMHIIHRHLAKDPGSFMDILNRPSFANRFLSVKEVIQRLPAASSLASPVKTELKQESRD
ncbi:hypothetical protein OESDEN_18718 [Oesophagostomum dentatum]|uniref:C2H2-type domain-containing protein n=1 Tax=Oesophagostomum dentatum TaxID=61180 RepID=A0A0B1SEH2_OESDE|nr:hypothetical protein OESDEN_18718 [Oesophagostomum dentatum]